MNFFKSQFFHIFLHIQITIQIILCLKSEMNGWHLINFLNVFITGKKTRNVNLDFSCWNSTQQYNNVELDELKEWTIRMLTLWDSFHAALAQLRHGRPRGTLLVLSCRPSLSLPPLSFPLLVEPRVFLPPWFFRSPFGGNFSSKNKTCKKLMLL